MVLDDPPNDTVGRFCSVVMANHLCALVKDRFEKIARELVLAILTILGRDLAPHVRDEDDVLQCRVAAEFSEHLEISSGDSGESFVGDAVDVNDPGKLASSLVSAKRFSREDRGTMNVGVCSRSGQVSCDHPQYIRVTLRGVVKSRSIDEYDLSFVESEHIRECDLGRTRIQGLPDLEIRTTCVIDKLEAAA